MNVKNYLIPCVLLIVTACNNTSKDTSSTDSTAVAADSVLPPKIELVKLWETDTVLNSSESVLFDEVANKLYVSCINGMPAALDKNGYIAKLTLDGQVEKLKWITGLNAPKGLGQFKNKLYVTDITKLVEIDIEKGKVVKSYDVPGAKFLNDITVDSIGVVYFTDSETHKIHLLKDGKISEWLNEGLNNPNGLFIESNRLLLASYGSDDFKEIDLATKAIKVIATDVREGDGVAYYGKLGHYVVSDWSGMVFLIEPDGNKNIVIDTTSAKINSADIEFIPSTKMLFVPTFFNNKVVAYTLNHNE